MEFIKSPEARAFKVKGDRIDEEDEQNLDGFNLGDHESKKIKQRRMRLFSSA